MELFENKQIEKKSQPLAERLRPKELNEIIGQEHLLGNDGAIRSFLNEGYLPSLIFWGPPGIGKTSIAILLAKEIDADFNMLSAVTAGVKEVRAIIDKSRYNIKIGKKTLLFIDEIHRFNKAQQDSLLNPVESGEIILIGATTENPSFEVNAALLSRCRIYKLNELTKAQIKSIIITALERDIELKSRNISIKELDILLDMAGGDARTALNLLESIIKSKGKGDLIITKSDIERVTEISLLKYDKKSENHYDTISAFIKSMRGSDPDAAVFWLAKMLVVGEDVKFIARRMVIFAAEDIGNADPNALIIANNIFDAVSKVGMPESRIILSQGVIYLATAPKSNTAYAAIGEAMSDIEKGASIVVPLHLRNAPTQLMKDESYGKDYKYPHNYEDSFVEENYFPTEFSKQYYFPSDSGREIKIKEKLQRLWTKKKY